MTGRRTNINLQRGFNRSNMPSVITMIKSELAERSPELSDLEEERQADLLTDKQNKPASDIDK